MEGPEKADPRRKEVREWLQGWGVGVKGKEWGGMGVVIWGDKRKMS